MENECNLFNDTFRNFEFSVYFAPPLHGVEENTISDFNSTSDSVVKSKRVKEKLHLCMQALCMQVTMVTYKRERDPQFFRQTEV